MSNELFGGDWGLYRDEFCRCPKCGRDEITECTCNDEIDQFEVDGFNSRDELFTQEEISLDFEMAFDMLEFGSNRSSSEESDFLKEFKESDYESTKRLR